LYIKTDIFHAMAFEKRSQATPPQTVARTRSTVQLIWKMKLMSGLEHGKTMG
jgi:hypothetical protein